jgi:alkylation response protein AidB-like acyl-CoA dehydrogenase
MNYEFSEQEQKLIEAVRQTAGSVMEQAAAGDLADPGQAVKMIRELIGALSASGYPVMGLTEDKPLTAGTMAAMEALAAAAPLSFIPLETSLRVVGRLVQSYGTPAQRQAMLPGLMDGSLIGTAALSEAALNVVNDPLTTRGVRQGTSVAVSGRKGFVVGARTADLLAVVGQLDDGLGVFLVDRSWPGVRLDKADVAAAFAPLHIGAVELENCLVPGDRVLGPVDGRRLLEDLRLWENQVLIAAAVGQMGAALFSATMYAKTRRSGGRPVIAYQEVGFKLAEMLTLTQTAQLMAYKAAWMAASGDRETMTVTDCAKVFCAESAEEVSGGALRILAAEGLAPGNPAAVAGRYAKFVQVAGTSTEIARVQIGDAMLKNA